MSRWKGKTRKEKTSFLKNSLLQDERSEAFTESDDQATLISAPADRRPILGSVERTDALLRLRTRHLNPQACPHRIMQSALAVGACWCC